jgi:hypothetical protein
VVGDETLLDEADQEQRQARAHVDAREQALLGELRQELGGAHDRTRDHGGEEGHEQHEVRQAPDRLELPAVHVDRVAERVEGVEADPDRQQDVERRRRGRMPSQPRNDVPDSTKKL